jgi:hypothetical protein
VKVGWRFRAGKKTGASSLCHYFSKSLPLSNESFYHHYHLQGVRPFDLFRSSG